MNVIKRYTTIPFKYFIYINFIMKEYSIFKRKFKTLGVFSSVHSEAYTGYSREGFSPPTRKVLHLSKGRVLHPYT